MDIKGMCWSRLYLLFMKSLPFALIHINFDRPSSTLSIDRHPYCLLITLFPQPFTKLNP